MVQVFISYKRENQTFAERLRDKLQTLGYNSWLDIDEIETGTYWPDEIDRGLHESDIVVGIVTAAAVQSRNVKNEWDWALMNHKRLLLVLIEPCTLPHRYISINYIDAVADEEQALEQIYNALENPSDHPQYRDDNTPAQTNIQTEQALPNISVQADNRARLLEKVRTFWIEGVLHNALSGGQGFTIQLDMSPSAVLRHPNYGDYVFPDTSLDILQIFNDMNRDMLILGAPGSGKTILLLQLAEMLLKQAIKNTDAALPVVFNLSSWAAEQKPLDEWLVDELRRKYQAPAKVAQEWIEREQLLLLLDGLDEVVLRQRDDCVMAINNFRQTYRLVDMVVCSRVADYEALQQQLDLQGAVTLQALSDEQVTGFLASEAFVALREALTTDDTLRQLSRTPFLLNTMAFAYHDATALQLRLTTYEASSQGRLRHLFDRYTDRRLKAQSNSSPYIPSETRYYLDWLGKQMVAHNQTLFYIEHLQPDWLNKKQNSNYQILSLLGIGGGVGIILSILLTVLLTLLSLVMIMVIFALEGRDFNTMKKIGQIAPAVLAFGGLPVALTLFISTSISNLWHGGRIRIEDTIVWHLVRRSALWGFVGILIGAITPRFLFSNITSPIIWIVASIAGGITLPFMHGFRSTERLQMRTQPNQGIRQTVLTRLRISAIVGIVSGLIAGISTYIYMSTFVLFLNTRLSNGLAATLIGMIVGVSFMMVIATSGFAILARHLLIRCLLVRQKQAPWNYADFLDYAAHDLLILRKVGGGYMFWHRYLLEYFAGDIME